MALHAITAFLSAALLFQVQLLMGSQLFPWFGGGAGVWTASLAFFQIALLVGYLAAHLISRLTARQQIGVQLLLVLISFALLSPQPEDSWKPAPGEDPFLGVLTLLCVHIGLPFVVLSTSAILLQRWLDVERPWVLYAASNAGSLVGLLTYPFLVEPALARSDRATLWTVGYAVFALLLGLCALRRWRQGEFRQLEPDSTDAGVQPLTRALWILLPACSSAAILAVASQFAQTIPPLPFLWVFPLAIHLATFVIAFAGPRWYPRRWVIGLLILSVWPVLNALYNDKVDAWPRLVDGLGERAVALAIGLFVLCLACHGELYRLRPHSSRLSGYYLCMALGGALGGMSVAFGAPLLLDGHTELNLVLVVSGLVLVAAFAVGARSRSGLRWASALAVLFVLAIGGRMHFLERALREGVVDQRRNFYGGLAIYELNPEDPDWHRLSMVNGQTEHGHQFQRPEWKGIPATYFTANSGVGLALLETQSSAPRKIGVVGLGIGTLAAYGREGDSVRYYEIDPNVIALAWERFEYLDLSRAELEIIEGDGRLMLEREEPNGFDVLVLDAFTAGVVPVHLLTRESFEIYLRHLAPDGVLVVQVTSKILDFRPVLASLARSIEMQGLFIESPMGIDGRGMPSKWIVLTRNRALLENPRVLARAELLVDVGAPLWTDERAPLLDLVDWR